jgi:hypothetical protein
MIRSPSFVGFSSSRNGTIKDKGFLDFWKFVGDATLINFLNEGVRVAVGAVGGVS